MNNMFKGASLFNQPLDSWDVSSVTDMGTSMRSMFERASSAAERQIGIRFTNNTLRDAVREWLENANLAEQKYGHISTWDVSQVTNMHMMFFGASSFNQPLDSWDVSSVTDMRNMFYGASSFNQPLDSWNVPSVTDMINMFKGASSFNKKNAIWYDFD